MKLISESNVGKIFECEDCFKIVFSKTYEGEIICDAFKRAATFQEKEDIKWIAEDFEAGGGHYVSEEKKVLFCHGIRTTPYYKINKKSLRFFGKKNEEEWKPKLGVDRAKYRVEITLEPLWPTRQYSEVAIKIRYQEYFDHNSVHITLHDKISDPANKEFIPMANKIIYAFTKEMNMIK